MIDTHCHLDLPVFDDDRAEVLARAHAAGVTDVVVPAIRPSTWAALADLPRRHPGPPRLHVAFGIHPQVVPFLDEEERAAAADLTSILGGGAVAVGECGLDAATGDHEEQERLLRLQIAVARELRLPLLVHVLRAHDVAPRLLREAGAADVGGIMHSYSGSPELVAIYRDLGFAFSLAGPVTYERARKPVAVARAIPDGLLLAETDAPDQTPVPHRGRRNEPAFVAEVIASLARARDRAPDEIAALTSANARRILALPAIIPA